LKDAINYYILKEIINKIDPFNIVWIDEDEYEPEILDLIKSLKKYKNLNKEIIFIETKKVFEKWFYKKDENEKKYYEIAKNIYKLIKR
jgi:hypothetical protein